MKALGFSWEGPVETILLINPPADNDNPIIRSAMIRAWIEVSAFVVLLKEQSMYTLIHRNQSVIQLFFSSLKTAFDCFEALAYPPSRYQT